MLALRLRIVLVTAVAVAVVMLPLLGAWLANAELTHLFEFPPPREIPRDYPRFSWWAAGAVIGAGLLVVGLWFGTRERGTSRDGAAPAVGRRRRGVWPAWGWWALGWTLVWWVLAWSRFSWFAPLQRYTFTPLWLGFIVVFNALAQQRLGTCLMLRAPSRWLWLFVSSGLFWWGFEWLNRFVRNWHYLTGGEVGATEYAIHASICFSTVLPAVAAVREWLGGFRWLEWFGANGPRWRVIERPVFGVGLGFAGAAGLVLTGMWPRHFYPALWLSPLLLTLGLTLGAGSRVDGWWSGIPRGDWRAVLAWALAALGCGFFWEMWNFHSLARWIYTVPFVERWHVFEMPLLGYTGYLPFGLECGLAVSLIVGAAVAPKPLNVGAAAPGSNPQNRGQS